MLVKDLMTPDPRACAPDDPVSRALDAMDACECGAVPIVDDSRLVVGIVTDRDIAFALRKNGSPDAIRVRECMTRDPLTVREDADAFEIVNVLAQRGVRRAPVVDPDGRLTGIVAQADIARGIDDDEVVASYLRTISAAAPNEPAPER